MKPLEQKQKDELKHIIRTSKKTREVLRAQAIIMLDEGDSHVKVKRMTGFSKTRAFHLRREYLKNGIESLKDKREGKPKQLLTTKQRALVLETVQTKNTQRAWLCQRALVNRYPGRMDQKEIQGRVKIQNIAVSGLQTGQFHVSPTETNLRLTQLRKRSRNGKQKNNPY